jgi:hypothetical protein
VHAIYRLAAAVVAGLAGAEVVGLAGAAGMVVAGALVTAAVTAATVALTVALTVSLAFDTLALTLSFLDKCLNIRKAPTTINAISKRDNSVAGLAKGAAPPNKLKFLKLIIFNYIFFFN